MGKVLRGVVVLGLAVVLWPASASATTIAGPPVFQRWADMSRVATPTGSVNVVMEPCQASDHLGYYACFDLADTIYLDPLRAGRDTFLHELGHVYDTRQLDDTERATISRIAGAKTPWPVLSEQFANDWRSCSWGLPAQLSTPNGKHKRVWAILGESSVTPRRFKRFCRAVNAAL